MDRVAYDGIDLERRCLSMRLSLKEVICKKKGCMRVRLFAEKAFTRAIVCE